MALVKCEHCGKMVEATKTVVVTTDKEEQWCDDCIASNAFSCSDCGILYSREFDYGLVNGYMVCRYCLDEYYHWCDSCERYVYYEDWDSDHHCCYSCSDEDDYNEYVGDYHSTDWNFFGKVKRGKWKGLGVELEIDRRSYDSEQEDMCAELLKIGENRIYLEHDGSLENGFEIISHPHTFKEFEKINWKKILEFCKEHGYQSHDIGTCGLHIHYSRNCFGANKDKQELAISKIIYFYETFWNDILKISRRTERQVCDWASRYCVRTQEDARNISKGKDKGSYSRYHAINLCNSATVEFRLGRGTLKAESFFAWIDFCNAIVRNSKKIKWADINNSELWLRGISDKTKEYIASKNAFQNTQEGEN